MAHENDGFQEQMWPVGYITYRGDPLIGWWKWYVKEPFDLGHLRVSDSCQSFLKFKKHKFMFKLSSLAVDMQIFFRFQKDIK